MSGVVISKAGGAAAAGGATAAKQDAQSVILADIETNTGVLATDLDTVAGAVAARSSTPDAAQPGIVLLGVLDVALASQTAADADGELTPFRVDEYGRLWTVRGDASSALVDGVHLGLPSIHTKVAEKYLRVTTASTGIDLWDPGAGNKIGVKWYVITWSGANACRITIWQGANADTTFSDGTDRVLFDENLSANAEGGVAFAYPLDEPWETDTDDHELHLTTSADKIVSITIGGYEKD